MQSSDIYVANSSANGFLTTNDMAYVSLLLRQYENLYYLT